MIGASLIPTTKFREAVLPRRSVADGQFLDPSDPAIHAITDFTREHPVTVDEDRKIDDALHDMIHLGARAMLVFRQHLVVDLISSSDLLGEIPRLDLPTPTVTRLLVIRA